MTIGILLHPYDEDNPAGLARTIFEWTKGMLEVDRENEYVIFVKKKPRRKPELPGSNWRLEDLGGPPSRGHSPLRRGEGGRFWLEKLRRAVSVDVMIFNTPVMPLFWKPPKSIIIALDYAYWYLAPKTLRGQLTRFATFIYQWLSLHRADHIVAISHATKDETVKLFGIMPEKISVIYCGFKDICKIPEQRINLPKKFFLFAGIVKPRKNILNIVKAFAEVHRTHTDYHLVIGGNANGKYYETIQEYIREQDMGNNVHFAGHLHDGELSYAYKRAEALVFPTLIEGFGYPVLEAMQCGLPVVTSDRSSLKEVGAGGAALLVDPYNPDDIAGAMERIISHPDERNKLVLKGYEQAKRFSWHKAAREMLDEIEIK